MTPGERLYTEVAKEIRRVFGYSSRPSWPDWPDLNETAKVAYQHAANTLGIEPPPREEGFYWIRSKDPRYPRTVVDHWTPDARASHGGFWSNAGSFEVEVLAGPLEPPK